MADLSELQEGWDHAAREDAMFNILTLPGYEGKWHPDDFFAHGQREIEKVFAYLDQWYLRGERRERALDFGCGVGRLAQALAEHYDSVDGVDVSSEMITRARDYAHQYGKGNCRFHVNTENNLQLLGDARYDFIYTVITLQHMPRELQESYVREFIRLLSPTGIATFHLPDGPDFHHPQGWLSMYCTDPQTVESWVTDAGGVVEDIALTEHSGNLHQGWQYTARLA